MTMFHPDGSRNPSLWGLVLAAGDGKRLQSYIRKVRGENLPKQYVNFIGRRSMLEHTFDRVERVIPPSQIVTVVSKSHLRYGAVRSQLGRCSRQEVIVQPENKDTGPGILLPLIHIYKRCPEAIVAVFPSDHFILEEDRFMDHVKLASRAVVHDSSRFVLLAMEPQHPEVEYGYILPRAGEGSISLWGMRSATRFVEKPDPATARFLTRSGALWNTMIMVFKVCTVLEAMQRLCPTMYSRFTGILDAIGTADETKITDEIYQTLEPLNFSTAFLEKLADTSPDMLSVLPVLQVSWSDWGSPKRLLRALELLGHPAQSVNRQQRSSVPAYAQRKNHCRDSVPWRADTGPSANGT